jgi:post-segregation antitoxin (ccd killing protein)|tara:strand:- start:1386 stop:3830 length:2445 start_codon:yes stop_codon:yes gene_type:complete
MAIEKPMVPSSVDVEGTDEVSVEIVNPEAISIGNDDGAMIIDFTGEVAEDIMGPDHDANLAEFIEEADLQSLASELIEDFISDRQSRKDWARAYVKGLDLLGMKIEERTQPWQGASGVFHPILTEATVRFQAQAMGEIFPASGPVRVKLVGKKDYEKVQQGERVEHEMNYLLTEEMTEYRDETEQMLFRLPLAGSSFKKVYYDPIMERPCAMFVPAEDFVVSYGASDLNTCPRYTHVMKKTPNEIVELQVNGFYIDVDLPDPEPDISDIQEKYDEIEGEVAVLEEDDRHTLLEMHVDLLMPEPFEDEDGIARPYIVTIDKSSETILAIRRNWYEGDSKKRKRQHFVHYRYLPGLGFYGTGLIHLIGGLAKSATSILRQLIDAGTLSNLPAGLKARGLRIKGDDSPLMPGEFRDVDVPGGAIRDSIAFLPYKEPSSVLYQLLGNIVEEGRRIGSVADVQIGNLNPQAPVGTTLALMERSMKVMSGVQARIHHSLKNELRLLAKIIKDYMPPQYSYEVDGDHSRQKDFDGRIDVIPVSDPNAATMSQRVVQYQAAMQLAQQAPHLYDLGKLHRQMLEVLGIKDAGEIIKLPDDIESADPVSENMSILKQEPVKAFKYQDHEAHISVHLAAAEDPKLKEIVGQSPFAGAIQAALAAHITEHVAFQYRKEIEKNLGVSMPDENAPLPDDVELELSRLASEAAQKLLRKDQAEMQQRENMKQQQDPLTQIQQREMSLKEAEFVHKKEMDIAKLQADMQSKSENITMQKDRLASEEQREGAKLGIKIASELEQSQKEDIREGTEIGLEIARELSNRNGEQ